jgi:hypothetical protein
MEQWNVINMYQCMYVSVCIISISLVIFPELNQPHSNTVTAFVLINEEYDVTDRC